MRILYTLLWYLLLPALALRLWWRGRRAPEYRRRWGERLGWYRRRRVRGSVWIHAVSVGETLAAAPLVRRLLEDFPDTPLVITTTTPTGSEQVRRLFGDRVVHVYCPWDLPGPLARFFRAFDPRLVLVMETELWPNMLAAAARRSVPVMLVNGRLSQKSHRNYARLRPLVRPMMASLHRLLVQTEAEARRFRDLGAREDAVRVTGSIKFDLDLDEALRQRAEELRTRLGERPLWLAASTHPGEDEAVLRAHGAVRRVHGDALLMLVPRHPERFDTVADQVGAAGLSLARRSREQWPEADTAVYLADTMGELLMLFGTCDLAFVGGSLVPVGGHNLLEPAAWEKPVLTGPHLHNFERIAALLEEAGGLSPVADEHELAERVTELLSLPEKRKEQGRAAATVVEAHRGALGRVVEEVGVAWPAA